jgi:predicted NBD/HSP70 family sugar kinase
MSMSRTNYHGAVTGATTQSLRQANLAAVLGAVHAHGTVRRSALTHDLGITRTTTAQVVGALVDWGLLIERQSSSAGRPGRPSTELAPGPAAPAAVAVEVSPEAVRAGVIGLGLRLGEVEEVRLTDRSPEAVAHRIAQLAGGLADPLAGRCTGVAVALYGLVGSDGRVELAPNLGWSGVPLRAMVHELVPHGFPVVVGNDASFATVYEARHGAGRGARTCLYLYGATGVGGGLTVDGRLVQGRHGYGGEVGHMLVNPGGQRCRCGRTGCWETEVDRAALRRRWPGEVGNLTDSQAAARIYEARAAGDPAAATAVLETARWLGEGIGTLLNVLDVDRVVLAGGLADLYAAAGPEVCATAAARRLVADEPVEAILAVSTSSGDAALLGAAERVLRPALRRPAAYVQRLHASDSSAAPSGH